MSDMDEYLQRSLESLEEGATLQESLRELPAGMEELRAHVELAMDVRESPHPVRAPESVRLGEQRILVQARGIADPQKPAQNTWWSANRKLLPALVGAALVFVILVAGLIGSVIWLIGSPGAQVSTLSGLSGAVLVSDDQGTWAPAQEGDRLEAGGSIRTDQDGYATLEYYDGSRTRISPNSELTMKQLDGGRGGVLQVTISQRVGTTQHNVKPFSSSDSQFLVLTPFGSASVHGTDFNVSVHERGLSYYSVERGSVVVENADSSVSLAAGQGTIALGDQAPAQPAYTFSLEDILGSTSEGNWTLAGAPVHVSQETFIAEDLAAGDLVRLSGRIVGGIWVTDLVQSLQESAYEYSFTGVIETMDVETWVINGVPVIVNEVTELEGEFQVGDAVRVKYIVLEGDRWLALEIEHLDDDDGDDDDATPTQTATMDPNLTPTVTGTADETPTALVTDCTGADPHPTGTKLAARYGVPYEEIMGWFCQRFGFGEIDLAYSLSRQNNLPVEEIFAQRNMGYGWGEIKRRATLLPTMTATATITPTATISPTVTISPTLTLTPTVTPMGIVTPTVYTSCTGANPHPKGTELARRYGVPYEEIMGWFCQGYGFGEIDLAYSLSVQHGVPVDQIFAMRQSGYGWGEIKAELKSNPTNPAASDKKDKDKDKDKEKDKDD